MQSGEVMRHVTNTTATMDTCTVPQLRIDEHDISADGKNGRSLSPSDKVVRRMRVEWCGIAADIALFTFASIAPVTVKHPLHR